MKAILPVAGNGTRMFPLGVTTPKCLLPILNKPLLVWSLESLSQAGITEVVLVISAGTFGNAIREFGEKISIEGLTIKFAIQEQQLGTAHVVQMARDHFRAGEDFVFINGDDLYGPDSIRAVIQEPGLAVIGKKVIDPDKWGILQANNDSYLEKVVEKPQEFVGDLANIGCMKLSARVFELYDQIKVSPRGEYELTDTLTLLAKETPVKVISSQDYWIPIGYPWHILDAAEHFLPLIETDIKGTVEEGVVIKGKLILPASSVIKTGTYIEGNVTIGENTQIGPGAHLRDNVCIGRDCKVGFGVEIKNSVIGDGTQVPHLAYIGDSILGKNVNFSAHCVTSNWRHDGDVIETMVKGHLTSTHRTKFGTVIGDNVRLGVGTKIYPGRKIWPNLSTRPNQIIDKDLME